MGFAALGGALIREPGSAGCRVETEEETRNGETGKE
jgi:hypothetical protein